MKSRECINKLSLSLSKCYFCIPSYSSIPGGWQGRAGAAPGAEGRDKGRCRYLFEFFPIQLGGLAQPFLETGSLGALAQGPWQVKSKCIPALPANGSPAPGGEPGRQMGSGPVLVAAQGGWELWLHIEAAGGSLPWRKFQSLNRTWGVHSWSFGLEASASKCQFPAQSSGSWLSLRSLWDLACLGFFWGGAGTGGLQSLCLVQVSTHPKSVANGKEAGKRGPRGPRGLWPVWRAWWRHPQMVQVGQSITSVTPHPPDPQLPHCDSLGSQPSLESEASFQFLPWSFAITCGHICQMTDP